MIPASSREDLERWLRAELPCRKIEPDPAISTVFDEALKPILNGYGVVCDLLQRYTIEKRVQHREFDGVHYIVFDHALLECFDLLDRLSADPTPLQTVRLALSRVFAEACRPAGLGLLYAFFIVSALRVFPILRRAKATRSHSSARRWQTLLILAHEAAHAFPQFHHARNDLHEAAIVSISALTTQLVSGMTGSFLGMLGEEENDRRTMEDIEVWLTVRDQMHIDDDTVFVAFERVGSDPRFVGEIACDSFAIAVIEREIAAMREADVGNGHSYAEAFVAAYRAFLHLRLLAYVDDVASHRDDLLDANRLEPFRLTLLVEVVFRGNLFVHRLLSNAQALLSLPIYEDLRKRIARAQDEHLKRIFEPANVIVETTLLDEGFVDALPDMLRHEGLDPGGISDDLCAVVDELDAIWVSQTDPLV